MKRIQNYMIVALLLCFYGVSAQSTSEKMTEQQAIELALSKSVVLNSAKLNVERQQANVGGSFELEPLSLEYRRIRVTPQTVVQEISAVQNFGSVLGHLKRHKLAKSEVKLAELNAEISEKEVLKNVRSLYQQWHYLYALKSLLEEQQENVNRVKDITHNLHQSGEIGGLENDITILQSLSVQTQKSTIYKSFSQVENELKDLLQLSKSIEPENEFPQALSFEFSEQASQIFEEAITQRDQVASDAVALSKSVYFPQISAGLINRKAGASNDFIGFVVGLQIPLPLGNNRAEVKKQKILSQEIAFQNEANKIKVQNHTKSLALQLSSLKTEIATISKTFEKAKTFIKKLSIAYEAGEIGAYKYNQSFDAYFEVMQNYLSLIHTYNQTVIEYEYYIN